MNMFVKFTGTWCGIELDESFGRNDGSINGVRYFTCDRTKGVFAPPSKLKLIPLAADNGIFFEGSWHIFRYVDKRNSGT